MRHIKTALYLILLVIFVIFILENTEVVSVKFLGAEIDMSRALMLLVVALVSFLTGYLTARTGQFRRRRQTKKQEQ